MDLTEWVGATLGALFCPCHPHDPHDIGIAQLSVESSQEPEREREENKRAEFADI
jgi:hypothetical protein